MPETSSAPDDASTMENSRRWWRWLFAALFVCVIAFVFAVGYPYYQAVQFLKFTRENGGSFKIEYNHPTWMSGWIDEKAYIPWYDSVRELEFVDRRGDRPRIVPISDQQLNQITRLSELRSLTIDVSKCDGKSISNVGNLSQLEYLNLLSIPENTSLDWLTKLSKIEALYVSGKAPSNESRQQLLNLPSLVRYVQQDDRNGRKWLEVDKQDGSSWIWAIAGSLHREDAESIMSFNQIQECHLVFSHATPEFWELLSQHTNIETLRCYERVDSKNHAAEQEHHRVTNVDFQSLHKMAGLKKLIIRRSEKRSNSNPLQALPAELQELQKNRPDIEIILE